MKKYVKGKEKNQLLTTVISWTFDASVCRKGLYVDYFNYKPHFFLLNGKVNGHKYIVTFIIEIYIHLISLLEASFFSNKLPENERKKTGVQ